MLMSIEESVNSQFDYVTKNWDSQDSATIDQARRVLGGFLCDASTLVVPAAVGNLGKFAGTAGKVEAAANLAKLGASRLTPQGEQILQTAIKRGIIKDSSTLTPAAEIELIDKGKRFATKIESFAGVDKVDFIEVAALKSESKFITREAPGIGINSGGGIEVVVNSGETKLQYFHMPGES